MFIVLYSFISTDWRKTAYWMILRTRFFTSGLSNSGQRKLLSAVGWEQGICKKYSAFLYNTAGQMLLSDSLRVLHVLRGIGLQCQQAMWVPLGMEIIRLKVLQVLLQGHCENNAAVAFSLLHSQDASYKTCLLGLVFSWHSLSCVLLSISSVWWAEQSLVSAQNPGW